MIRALLDYDDDLIADVASQVRTGVPNGDWTRKELAERAAMENQAITRRENDASHYWFLGKALLPIRADFDDSAWTRWREKNEIERTRGDRAMVLARAFGSPEEFAGLSIANAHALARQVLGIGPRQTPLEAKHRRRLKTISETVQTSLDDLAGPDAAQLRVHDEWLLAIENATRLLRELRHAYVLAGRSRSRRSGFPA